MQKEGDHISAPECKYFLPFTQNNGERIFPSPLSAILPKLGKLRQESAVMIVLLSTILASVSLVLVPLVHISALPFLLMLTAFMLLGIRSLPKIKHPEDSAFVESVEMNKNHLYPSRLQLSKTARKRKQAEIVKYVFFNPKSSISKIALEIGTHEDTTRKLVEHLLADEKPPIIRHNGEIQDTFSTNYENFSHVADIIRKLNTLEEQLTNFDF